MTNEEHTQHEKKRYLKAAKSTKSVEKVVEDKIRLDSEMIFSALSAYLLALSVVCNAVDVGKNSAGTSQGFRQVTWNYCRKSTMLIQSELKFHTILIAFSFFEF